MPRLLLFVLVLASLTDSLSAQVRTINLSEMASSAGIAFVGTVAARHSGLDETGDIVTWTTFRVERPIGYLPVSMVTVKQLGGTANGISNYLSHMRYFQPGERVLAMFYPTSELGFTSPIGLDQAVWNVTDDGRVAGIRDEALAGVESQLARHGLAMSASHDLPLNPFVSLIEELLQGRTTR
ncbi:MAG: hypothetical protein H7X80_03270 [bacterium]|nr:hypothetical protein [Candidatus Kapabacteria bacterium]